MEITLENVKVKKLIYYNNKNCWGVFAISVPKAEAKKQDANLFEFKNNPELIVTGNFEGVYEEATLNVTGEVTEHPKYGKQLALHRYIIQEDNSSKQSIINFLTKSSINGIHKALAQRIYDKFKDQSIEIVLHQTERLQEVQGIGEKTYKVVKDSVQTYFDMEELIKYCAEIGLHKFNLTVQLYKEFGKDAVKYLKQNPYQLLEKSEALTFKQVDEIAMKAGVKADDDNRLQYGLLYVLTRESILRGSTGCEDMQLKSAFQKTLGTQNNQLYRYALKALADKYKIVRDDVNVYLSAFYNAEKSVASQLKKLNNTIDESFYKPEIIDEEIHNFPFQLNDDQVKAVHSCLTHQFNIITSAAGCGKTTISKTIVNVLARHDVNIILLAPTAKAAKRLSECTGREAFTIHRFLHVKDSTLESSKEVQLPRQALILIDEASMVDVRLFEKVLDILKIDTRLVLVGDTHQLPSVQAGNILEDIINSEKFNVCYLRDITRQAEDSNIIKYSNLVNEGNFIPLTFKSPDFICTSAELTQRPFVLKALKESYKKNVDKYGLLNVQVLCAYKQGILGMSNINTELKKAFNPAQPQEEEIFPFNIGDKVRHTVNNYDLNVFNGETGIVQKIMSATDDMNLAEQDVMVVDFGDRIVTYDKFNAGQLTLAYASTVHASQGSEYDCVYVILDNEISNVLLVRKIVYTAITRAKKKCYILNVGGCINTAISNNHYKERLTKLYDFLIEE